MNCRAPGTGLPFVLLAPTPSFTPEMSPSSCDVPSRVGYRDHGCKNPGI